MTKSVRDLKRQGGGALMPCWCVWWVFEGREDQDSGAMASRADRCLRCHILLLLGRCRPAQTRPVPFVSNHFCRATRERMAQANCGEWWACVDHRSERRLPAGKDSRIRGWLDGAPRFPPPPPSRMNRDGFACGLWQHLRLLCRHHLRTFPCAWM